LLLSRSTSLNYPKIFYTLIRSIPYKPKINIKIIGTTKLTLPIVEDFYCIPNLNYKTAPNTTGQPANIKPLNVYYPIAL
jgi:hypothetical protein